MPIAKLKLSLRVGTTHTNMTISQALMLVTLTPVVDFDVYERALLLWGIRWMNNFLVTLSFHLYVFHSNLFFFIKLIECAFFKLMHPLLLNFWKFNIYWSICSHTGYLDDIIEPRETRRRLCADLELLSTKKQSNPVKKHSNIPL